MSKLLTPSDLPSPAREFLESRLQACRARIGAAAERAGRDPRAVQLLAVTKYVDADVVRLLYELGQRDFGENRMQPALRKAEVLSELEGLRLHFVGHLQRNKVRDCLDHFVALHSLDSERLARELDQRARAASRPVPELYVEVNIAGEAQKTGLDPDELPSLLRALDAMPRLKGRLQGLMAMAPYSRDAETSRVYFRRLRELRDAQVDSGLLAPGAGLSMGMSGDFEVAVEEGATVVRVGTSLFEA